MNPKITLDQWQALLAVVDHGGYANAAEALGKSQSAISYAVQKLETALALRAFKIQGRKAVLTPVGELLYRRAKLLVDEAEQLEHTATQMGRGWEPLVRINADGLFPAEQMLDALQQFADHSPQTRIEYVESILSGAEEALLRKDADVVITTHVPPGFIGHHLMSVRFMPVAAPHHPLNRHSVLHLDQLRQHRQIVLRDSGRRRIDAGWLGAEQRWTVSTSATRHAAIISGLGFTWMPEREANVAIARGDLKRLPLPEDADRFSDLYLVLPDGDLAGQATHYMAACIKKAAI